MGERDSLKVLFFLWELGKKRLPIGYFLFRVCISEVVGCSCCDTLAYESFKYFFINNPVDTGL